MNNLINLINENAAFVNLLFSFVVAGATVFYALLTRALVSETRRMREVQTEPVISISIEPSEHGLNFLNLTIQNVGQGAARSIKLRAEPSFQRARGQFLGDLGLFKHGIKYLAPGQRITFFLTSVLDDVHGPAGDLSRLNFTVEVSYDSALGEHYAEAFPIHFESLEGLNTIGTPALISIADELKKIEREISYLAGGFRKLHVITESQAEVTAANERLLAERSEKTLAAKNSTSADETVVRQEEPANAQEAPDEDGPSGRNTSA
jgi:hypothetical protein